MKFFLIAMMSSSLLALTPLQIKNINIAKNIGSKVKAKDGTTFEKALCGILLQESSAGLEIIGDSTKNGKLQSLYKSSLGAFQIQVKTAKLVIQKDPYMNRYFKGLLTNDKRLVNMLFTNVQFSALIAAEYLKMTYNEALKRGFKHPWRKAISRYNGGWNNTKYINRVLKRIRFLKRNHYF